MPKSIDQMRRDAKALRRAYEAQDAAAAARVASKITAGKDPLKHADFLHVIARENGHESWPKLAWAAETIGLDRAEKQERLKMALFHGQTWRVDQLLKETPDLADGMFGLQCALLDREAVEAALADDPSLATRKFGPRTPILHLAFSRHLKAHAEKEADMLAIAEMLVANGADVNDGFPFEPGDDHLLSALYGAIGHADNMVLGRWLLDKGADPNDGESLYHATELGHHEGLKMLLAAGAKPDGTNALPRAMDFDDVEAVRMLLDAGASVDDFNAEAVGGELPVTIPALHQAARRRCSREMAEVLLDAGADPSRVFEGLTPYALARAYGHAPVFEPVAEAGGTTAMSDEVARFVAIGDGTAAEGTVLDPAKLPDELRTFAAKAQTPTDLFERTKRLIAAGLEYDRSDGERITPVQIAGWQGLPEVLSYFLGLKPDLGYINGYGGTLLSTIIHGSENCPDRAERDHIACLRLALEEGVALPKPAIRLAGEPEVAAFLAEWAETHPGQVVEHGIG